MRSEEIKNYDWASHVLQYSLSKVRRFLYVISSSDVSKRHSLYFYSSCLPMFGVSVGNSICFICFPYYYFCPFILVELYVSFFFIQVMYMDFLDLHQNYESGYHLVYGVPRFCHVSTEDFNFITDVDVDINRSRYLCYG